MKTVGIILLGGKGNRLNNELPKQFIEVENKLLCEYAIEKFEESPFIDEICLTRLKGYDEFYDKLKLKYKKIKYIVDGGSERQNSVFNALKALEDVKTVVIHDGARPFVTLKEIEEVVKMSLKYDCAITAKAVSDTIKKGDNSFVVETVKRDNLFSVKTPQAFSYDVVKNAHLKAIEDNFLGTDDSSLVERLNKKVYIVEAFDNNIKVTTNIDLIVMRAILKGE